MKKIFACLLIVLLVVAVSACGNEEIPSTSTAVEKIVFVKMVNSSGESIPLDCSCDWNEDYLSGSYYLDITDFKIAQGEDARPTKYDASQLSGFEDLGDGKFKGSIIGIAAPITEDDIALDSSSSMITVADLVGFEASYGDMVLLKWNGSGFDVEVVEGNGSEFDQEYID